MCSFCLLELKYINRFQIWYRLSEELVISNITFYQKIWTNNCGWTGYPAFLVSGWSDIRFPANELIVHLNNVEKVNWIKPEMYDNKIMLKKHFKILDILRKAHRFDRISGIRLIFPRCNPSKLSIPSRSLSTKPAT